MIIPFISFCPLLSYRYKTAAAIAAGVIRQKKITTTTTNKKTKSKKKSSTMTWQLEALVVGGGYKRLTNLSISKIFPPKKAASLWFFLGQMDNRFGQYGHFGRLMSCNRETAVAQKQSWELSKKEDSGRPPIVCAHSFPLPTLSVRNTVCNNHC